MDEGGNESENSEFIPDFDDESCSHSNSSTSADNSYTIERV